MTSLGREFPFYSAISNNDVNLVRLMVEEGVCLNISNCFGDSPLLHACFKEKYDIVEYFLKVDASNVNKQNIGGYTPLFVAAGQGNYGIVDLLLRNGADANIRDHYGRTPVFESTYYGTTSVIHCKESRRKQKSYFNITRLLLENPYGVKADPNISIFDWNINSVVHSINDEKLMGLMILHKADLKCLIPRFGEMNNRCNILKAIKIMSIDELYMCLKQCKHNQFASDCAIQVNNMRTSILKTEITNMWIPFLVSFKHKGLLKDIGNTIKSFLI